MGNALKYMAAGAAGGLGQGLISQAKQEKEAAVRAEERNWQEEVKAREFERQKDLKELALQYGITLAEKQGDISLGTQKSLADHNASIEAGQGTWGDVEADGFKYWYRNDGTKDPSKKIKPGVDPTKAMERASIEKVEREKIEAAKTTKKSDVKSADVNAAINIVDDYYAAEMLKVIDGMNDPNIKTMVMNMETRQPDMANLIVEVSKVNPRLVKEYQDIRLASTLKLEEGYNAGVAMSVAQQDRLNKEADKTLSSIKKKHNVDLTKDDLGKVAILTPEMVASIPEDMVEGYAYAAKELGRGDLKKAFESRLPKKGDGENKPDAPEQTSTQPFPAKGQGMISATGAFTQQSVQQPQKVDPQFLTAEDYVGATGRNAPPRLPGESDGAYGFRLAQILDQVGAGGRGMLAGM